MKRSLFQALIGLILILGCSKNNSNNQESIPQGYAKYTIKIGGAGVTSGGVVVKAFNSTPKSYQLNTQSTKEIEVISKIGELVYITLPSANLGIVVKDSKDVIIADISPNTTEVFFMAMDPDNPNKDAGIYKIGLAKDAYIWMANKKYILEKRYYDENGAITDLTNSYPCTVDDEYLFVPETSTFLYHNPNMLYGRFIIKQMDNKCVASEPYNDLWIWKVDNNNTNFRFPVFTMGNIKSPYLDIEDFHLDNLNNTNGKITFNRVLNGKKEVFIYKRKN